MSELKVFEFLLVISLCLWAAAFLIVGPPIIRAIINLKGHDLRNTRFLVFNIANIGALCTLETILLYIRIKYERPYPYNFDHLVLWSVPLVLILVAIIFIHIGFIIRRGTSEKVGGALL